MELHRASRLNHSHCTRSKLCVSLSQMALDRRELEIAPQFNGKTEILPGAQLNIHVLPENLFRLEQLSLGTLDVPSALQRISEVGIENLVSVGQTLSMKLSIIARLYNLIWPSQTPKKRQLALASDPALCKAHGGIGRQMVCLPLPTP